MSDIIYRPDLEVERSYYSDGTIPQSVEQGTNENQDDSKNPIEEIRDKIDKLKNVSITMPDDIGKMFDDLIANGEYIAGLIDEDSYDPDLKPIDINITIPDDSSDNDSNDSGDDLDDFEIFSTSVLDDMKIEITKTDIDKVIDNNYHGDLLAVLEDYLFKMQDTASKYMASIFNIASEAKITNVNILTAPYLIKTSEIKDKNLMHLSDAIIRSEVVRKQRVKLLGKLSNTRETSLHVKTCKAASEFKARYLTEKYTDPKSTLDLYNNVLLSDSISDYEKKYEENFRNLYKYMNSSVILIDECLSTFLKEAQGKAILINKGEIKI